VEYAAERLDVRGLSLVNGDATIRVEGTLGDPETPLAATLEQVGIETLNDLLPEGRTMAGRLDGVVRVAGPFDALRYDARAHVVAGEVDGLKFDSIGGDVSLDRRRLGLDVRLEAGTLGTFAAVGTMPLSFGEPSDAAAPPYDLTVTSSELNLGFFQPLTTEIANITGTSRMNIRVLGPAEQPELSGTVNVAGAAFDVVPTGVSYTQLNADFTVKGQQVIVERLTLQDTDGHVATVQGELNVPRLGPPSGFELRITADEVHVLENAYGEVALSADIQAMGDLETPLLSGTISVDRAVIEASDLLDRLSARGYQRAPVSEGDNPELGSYDRASVSITLALPDNVIVRGRDLRSGSGPLGLGDVNVTIGGALTIAKETGGRPTLEGRVDVVRGSYQFQGRRFEIQRGGELRFLRSLTNPTLDVDAEREISGVTANVHLGGTLERPELVLTSTPALDQGDILALVVFGQTMNTLPSSQRVSLAARAGVIAAGAIATPLSDSVARALDLDQFEIRPAESATGASVIVGRQVNERLFVGFEQEFGSDEASQVNFEYRVNEFLRIVTSFAQGGTNSLRSRRAEAAGIDLIFVIR
jgi:translocation and assembly module TamB